MCHQSNTWDAENSAMKKKWVWLSVNGCQCKSPVSTTTNFSTHAKPGQTQQCAQKIMTLCEINQLHLTL